VQERRHGLDSGVDPGAAEFRRRRQPETYRAAAAEYFLGAPRRLRIFDHLG